jgi:hypothetical protein
MIDPLAFCRIAKQRESGAVEHLGEKVSQPDLLRMIADDFCHAVHLTERAGIDEG